jgi:hypothetical protein
MLHGNSVTYPTRARKSLLDSTALTPLKSSAYIRRSVAPVPKADDICLVSVGLEQASSPLRRTHAALG